MSNFQMQPSHSGFCASNDLSCVLHSQPLCNFASNDPTDKIFGGNMTQTIVQIFNKAFPRSGGFCSLPKIGWDKEKFMVLEGEWKGLINGIGSHDVSAPFMAGYDSDHNRLFLTIKTEPSIVTTLFQKENDFTKHSDEAWFIGGGRGGPFEPFFPYFSHQWNCVKYLRELVEEKQVTVSYMRRSENMTSPPIRETKTFYIES